MATQPNSNNPLQIANSQGLTWRAATPAWQVMVPDATVYIGGVPYRAKSIEIKQSPMHGPPGSVPMPTGIELHVELDPDLTELLDHWAKDYEDSEGMRQMVIPPDAYIIGHKCPHCRLTFQAVDEVFISEDETSAIHTFCVERLHRKLHPATDAELAALDEEYQGRRAALLAEVQHDV